MLPVLLTMWTSDVKKHSLSSSHPRRIAGSKPWTLSCSPHYWEQSPVPPRLRNPPGCAATGRDVPRTLDPKLPSRSAQTKGISIPAVALGVLKHWDSGGEEQMRILDVFLGRVSGVAGNSVDFLCSVVVITEVVKKGVGGFSFFHLKVKWWCQNVAFFWEELVGRDWYSSFNEHF